MKLDHNQKKRIIEIAVIVVLSCVLFLACNHNPLNNDIVISNESDSSEEEESAFPQDDSGTEVIVTTKEKSEPANVCVYVCGGVVNPGLYELPEGSRRMEAVEMAGGFTEDACTDYVNLADRLSDGEMLRIPFRDEITSYPLSGENGGGGGSAGFSDSRVNINTASLEELCTIPGIGKAKAEAILKYRSSGGKFETSEDLMKIPGIKQGTYEKLRDYIRVG